MPQKLTTTACFIQGESSGGKKSFKVNIANYVQTVLKSSLHKHVLTKQFDC